MRCVFHIFLPSDAAGAFTVWAAQREAVWQRWFHLTNSPASHRWSKHAPVVPHNQAKKPRQWDGLKLRMSVRVTVLPSAPCRHCGTPELEEAWSALLRSLHFSERREIKNPSQAIQFKNEGSLSRKKRMDWLIARARKSQEAQRTHNKRHPFKRIAWESASDRKVYSNLPISSMWGLGRPITP